MMTYFMVYGAVGILMVAFQKWLFNKYPTREEEMCRIAEGCVKLAESMQHPEGMPFSDRSARFIGESIALIIAIVGWPVIAFNLLRRAQKSPDTDSEE